MSRIILVGGSKGGVGKSVVSLSLIDYYLSKNKPFLFVETDTSNPDVGKIYTDILGNNMLLIDLDKKDGWIALLNAVGGIDYEQFVIINTAARSNTTIKEYGALLNDALDELDRTLITLWPINRQRDSVELLKDYTKSMTNSVIFVLKNAYFGTPEKFELFDASKIKTAIGDNGGTRTFPDLADRVVDYINTKRLPVQTALNEMPIGNRLELKRWRNECAALYDEILGC